MDGVAYYNCTCPEGFSGKCESGRNMYLPLYLSLPLSMYGLFLCLLDNETDSQADRRIDRQTDAHTRLEYNKYD